MFYLALYTGLRRSEILAPGLQEAAAGGFDKMILPRHEDEEITHKLLTKMKKPPKSVKNRGFSSFKVGGGGRI